MLAASYGMTPDPWEQNVLNDWMGIDENGIYTSLSCGLSVPRQNGKNAIVEMREVYGVLVKEHILHTAHRVDTARKAFLRLASFFENPQFPEMSNMVKDIRRTNGQEAILLKNGGSVEFSSRVNGGKRGFTSDVVVFDEAQELTDDQMEAIMSTMAAAPSGNRQLIYTGTPPTPVSPGTVFRRERDSALRGGDGRQCWHEWSVEKVGDVWDRDRWYATNPGLGIRLSEEFTAKECATLSREGFARERLGWWNPAGHIDAVISEQDWKACFSSEPAKEGLVCYAAKFSADGAIGTLAACRKPEKGIPHVEVIDSRNLGEGIGWMVDWLLNCKTKPAQIVVDGAANSQNLIDRLIEGSSLKKSIIKPTSAQFIAATSTFCNAVKEHNVTHYIDEALDNSALKCGKRKIGNSGGYGFVGNDEADSTLIESCCLAYWAAMTTKRNPNRKARVAF